MSKKHVSQLKFESNPKMNRSFSNEFKKQKVKEIIEKQITVQQLSDLYGVSRSAIYKWIYKFSNSKKTIKQVVEMESESMKTKLLLEKVAELERKIGQKQLEIDFLSETLVVVSEDLGYDVKKKHGPKSSRGFKKDETKTTTK